MNMEEIPDNQLMNALFRVVMGLAPIKRETEEDKLNNEIINDHLLIYIKEIRNYKSEQNEDYNNEVKYKIIGKMLIKITLSYWSKNNYLPNHKNFDEYLQHCYEYMLNKHPCECNLNITGQEIIELKEIIEWSILNIGNYPTCNVINGIKQFTLINKQFPTLEEFGEYIKNIQEFEVDPDKYYQKTKHKLPTANLSKLKKKKYEKNLNINCSICHDDILLNQYIVELPCSGKHIYHHDENDCLKNLSIMNWLKSNKFCPVCRDEIKINE